MAVQTTFSCYPQWTQTGNTPHQSIQTWNLRFSSRHQVHERGTDAGTQGATMRADRGSGCTFNCTVERGRGREGKGWGLERSDCCRGKRETGSAGEPMEEWKGEWKVWAISQSINNPSVVCVPSNLANSIPSFRYCLDAKEAGSAGFMASPVWVQLATRESYPRCPAVGQPRQNTKTHKPTMKQLASPADMEASHPIHPSPPLFSLPLPPRREPCACCSCSSCYCYCYYVLLFLVVSTGARRHPIRIRADTRSPT